MSGRRRRRDTPRRTARAGLPVEGAVRPRHRAAPAGRGRATFLLIALVALTLVAGIAGRRIMETGYFEVTRVVVTGAGAVDEASVLEAAGVAGRPIWQVDPAATARAIERFPVVRRATVSRIWPNQVAIMIEERVPSAVWRSAAAEVVVDDDGVVLDAPVMGGLVSVIHTDGRDPLAPGDRVDGDAVRLAMTIGAVLPVETGQRVARIEYSSSGGLDVVTDRGQRLRLGDGQNLDYKLNLWRAITAQARAERITPTEVDLRFGRWAAVR